MSERHVARCDGPNCGQEAPLKTSVGTQSWAGSGVSYPTTDYVIPDGWRQLESATLCSWKCLSEYAAKKAEHGR